MLLLLCSLFIVHFAICISAADAVYLQNQAVAFRIPLHDPTFDFVEIELFELKQVVFRFQ